MKTEAYYNSLEKICMFCDLANDGIIIAEINDVITRKELINDLNVHFCIKQFSLDELFDIKKSDEQHPQNSIFIINQTLTTDTETAVINLNFNRDWLLGLHCKIILIVSSAITERLIEYSYNFWSCVSLHEKFTCDFKCVITPCFLDDKFNVYENDLDLNRKKLLQKSIRNGLSVVDDVILKIWGSHKQPISVSTFEDFLFEKYQKNEFDNINEFFERIMRTADEFYAKSMYKMADVCYCFIYDKLLSRCQNYVIATVRFLEAISKNFYRLKKYDHASDALALLIEFIEKNPLSDDILPQQKIAEYWNNLGVVFYFRGDNENALTCFNTAAEILNSLPISSQLCDVLFNLSLISFSIKDSHNAKYYINEAIKYISQFSTRWFQVTHSRYCTLKSYIDINYGNISEAEKNIRESLHILRQELIENHQFILESHYVFALVFLYKNDLEKANSCANKALAIATNINSKNIKPYVWELLGEILYELKEYSKARLYLNMAYVRAIDKEIFDKEILNWMEFTIKQCDKLLGDN